MPYKHVMSGTRATQELLTESEMQRNQCKLIKSINYTSYFNNDAHKKFN